MPQFLDLEDLLQETEKKKFLDLEDLPQDEVAPQDMGANQDLINFTNQTNRVIPQIARNPQTFGADALPFRDKARYVADQWLQNELPTTPVIENGIPIGRLPTQPAKKFLDLEDLPEDIPAKPQPAKTPYYTGQEVVQGFQANPTWMNGLRRQPVQPQAPTGGVLDLDTMPSIGKIYFGEQAPRVPSTETPERSPLKTGFQNRVEPIVGGNLIKPAPTPDEQQPAYTMLNPKPEDVSGEQKIQAGSGKENWFWPEYKYATAPGFVETPLETFHKALDIPMTVLTNWTGGGALNADKLLFYGISKVAPSLTGGETSLTEAMDRLDPYQKGSVVKAMGELARFAGEIQSTSTVIKGIKGAISPTGTEIVKWTPQMFPPKELALYEKLIQKTADKLPSWALSGAESGFIDSLTVPL